MAGLGGRSVALPSLALALAMVLAPAPAASGSAPASVAVGRQSGYGYSGYSGDSGGYGGYGGDLQTAASGGGYGHSSYSKCDCTKYDILGVVAGGAALAALGLYLLLQQAAANRSLGGWTPSLPQHIRDALLEALPRHDLAGSAVSATCRVSRLLETGELSLSTSSAASARSGYKDDDADCDCFRAIVGALAGFAALAALAAFALQQAVAAANAKRSLSSAAGFSMDADGLRFVSRYLRLLMDSEDPCLPHRLCQIGQDASRLDVRLYTGVRLASLPVSWFLSSSSTSPHTFSDYCDAISDVDRRGGCDAIFTRCTWPSRHQTGNS